MNPIDFEIIFYYNGRNLYSISKLAAIFINSVYEKNIKVISYRTDLTSYAATNKSKKLFLLFSFTTPDSFETFNMIKSLKKYKNVILLAGGPHSTALPENSLDNGFDYVFRGEAETTLPKFFEKYFTNKSLENIILNTDSIDINNYPPFAYNLNLITPIEIMRGCCNKCRYCQTPQLFSSIKYRTPESVAPYLKYYELLRGRYVNFSAPLGNYYYNFDLNKLTDLFEKVKTMTNLKLCFGHFPSELHPKFITEDLLKIMRSYCDNKKISIGFQSGSQKILDLINRKITVSEMIETVKLSNSYGFNPIIDFIFGLPKETKEDRNLSKELISDLCKKYEVLIHPHIFIPLPDTEFWMKEPTDLENDFLEFLENQTNLGSIKLNWKKHIEMRKKIIEFRNLKSGA
ncbi:MAG TPA: TIGR04013 family B12-binding domain/radical SAM domain-containing protein [bacterium]|nr:TIGR04013 family B12-binding domain/radical SAM domain-containing protein [bacterium]HPN31149.1 TIGR04013 family B12-binding domain/radical SAM domain-containing protein [bacterium]